MAGQVSRTGSQGTRTQVITNSFEVRFAREPLVYNHYREIVPHLDKSRRAFEVMDVIQRSYPQYFNPRAVFDGRENVFSPADIPSHEFEARMSNRPGKGIFTVKFARVGRIEPRNIRDLMSAGGVQQGTNTMALNLLQLVLRQATNMRHGFAPDARAFFVPTGSQRMKMGLQAWHGYFQSVRPVLDRLLVNVDIVNSLVYQPGPLIALALEFLGQSNVRALEQLSQQDIRRLRSHLKGLNIVVVRTGQKTDGSRRGRPIKDIIPRAGQYEFEKDGTTTTVRAHYQQTWNIRLQQPNIFGVRIGRDAVIPAELCEVVPGQLYKKKIPADMSATFVKFATQRPDARLRSIQDAVSGKNQVFDYQASDFVREVGMSVSSSPLTISGRRLHVPRILYKSGPETIRADKGSWNVVDKKLLIPGSISSWLIVSFDERAQLPVVQNFAQQLMRCLEKLGLKIDQVPSIQKGQPYQASQTLEGLGRQLRPAIVVALLPANAPELRREIKNWGDVVRGVPTQCVRGGKWEGANNQYFNNVALKINAKLGGINSKVEGTGSIVPQGTMVVGMDVGHPSPGVATRPSVTSLVASVNWDCTQYVAFCGVQPPREEMIQNLEEMLTKAMTQFALRWNGSYPASIVFFRDGVSEGEYEIVSNNEIAKIKEILQNMEQINKDGNPIPGQKAYKPNAQPKIVFIVVGKRHHVRFFPRSQNESDGSGNCQPGFIVDDGLANAKYPDYYLQSHGGIHGTSRPGHYVVLVNELNLKPDDYQRLSFDLCHVYASATRSVSIPAPVYYADATDTILQRVCARAENHFAEGLRLDESDTASTTTGSRGADFDLSRWQSGFHPAQINMLRQMYYL